MDLVFYLDVTKQDIRVVVDIVLHKVFSNVA